MSDQDPPPVQPDPEDQGIEEGELWDFVRGCLKAGQPPEDDPDE